MQREDIKQSVRLLLFLACGGFTMTTCDAIGAVLFQQQGVLHRVGEGVGVPVDDHVIHVDVNQQKPSALRISARIRTEGVTGPTGRNLVIVTNINYEKTPVFYDTILYPRTGTHPWQYCERYVRPRLPIASLDIHFRLTNTKGQAWFKDFTVEEVPEWQGNDDLVVAMLGDSTDMGSYIEDAYRVHRYLEMLLQDRFPEHCLSVRNFAESGDYLGKLLESGRLARELDTLSRCDIAVIRYGLNDQGHRISPAEFNRQLGDTCDRILDRFPQARIVLATTIPPQAPKMSEQTRAVAAARGYPLVDIAKALTEHAAAGDANWHTGLKTTVGFPMRKNPADNPTGLKGDQHPNVHGTRLIAHEVYRTIEPIAALLLKQGTVGTGIGGR